MTRRNELLKKYISEKDITDWFSHKKNPSAESIKSVFTLAAQDYKSGKISHEDFSLICTNLYFEGIVLLSLAERKPIGKNTITALEAFADPHGHLLDPQGVVLVDEQNKILDLVLSNL